MNSISYHRTLPVRREADVMVAGGGPAGIAAAVTAARSGAKVFLAETLGAFGGMGTSGGLPFFCRPTAGIFSPPDSGRKFMTGSGKRAAPGRRWCATNTPKRSAVSSTTRKY